MPGRPHDRITEHLTRSLRANPLWQASDVLASRAQALRLETHDADAAQLAADTANEKAALREGLAEIRGAVWDTPTEQTVARLANLPLERHPELAATADRLRAVAAAREEAVPLASGKHYDADFFEQFQKVLVSSPSEAAATREQVTAAFADRGLRRRGLRMVRLMRSSAPRLYAIEAEWLDRLLRSRQPVRMVGQSRGYHSQTGWTPPVPQAPNESSSGSGYGCLWWIVVFAIVRILAAVASGG